MKSETDSAVSNFAIICCCSVSLPPTSLEKLYLGSMNLDIHAALSIKFPAFPAPALPSSFSLVSTFFGGGGGGFAPGGGPGGVLELLSGVRNDRKTVQRLYFFTQTHKYIYIYTRTRTGPIAQGPE